MTLQIDTSLKVADSNPGGSKTKWMLKCTWTIILQDIAKVSIWYFVKTASHVLAMLAPRKKVLSNRKLTKSKFLARPTPTLEHFFYFLIR